MYKKCTVHNNIINSLKISKENRKKKLKMKKKREEK